LTDDERCDPEPAQVHQRNSCSGLEERNDAKVA
jgi:hypothetical protein